MFSSESQPEALNMRGIPQSKLIEFDELVKKIQLLKRQLAEQSNLLKTKSSLT